MSLKAVVSSSGGGGGSGTVTTVSVTTANGVSGSVATATTTPAITLTLGAITPTSVSVTGSTIPANGIYLSAANTLDFSTNSTKQLEITSVGQATLGTTSEASELIINTNLNGGFTVTSPNTSGPSIRLNSTSANGHDYRFFSTGSANHPTGGTGTFGVYDATAGSVPISIFGGVSPTAGGYICNNAAGVYAWNDAAGNAIFDLPDTGLSRVSAKVVAIGDGSLSDASGTLKTTTLTLLGKAATYNNVTTAGWGVPAIYGSGRVTAQNAANASIATYTVGAADGTFLVSANVLVTTSTLHTFTVTCAYTDEGNTARVLTLPFSSLAGAFVTSIANASGAVPYEGVPLHIRCKAATSITIATAAGGTYTTVTYNAEGAITQIA